MASKKKRRDPRSLKSKKRKTAAGRNRGKQSKPPAETNEPFEQDAKRRIGQHPFRPAPRRRPPWPSLFPFANCPFASRPIICLR